MGPGTVDLTIFARQATAAAEALAGQEAASLRKLADLCTRISTNGLPTLVPLLPLVFQLQGRPYTLEDRFPFEPFFATHCPRAIVLKCGRQVSKSTSAASQGIIQAACFPYFNTLFVTPLGETVTRFSQNYVQAFIDDSPVKSLLVHPKAPQRVLQRSLRNRSILYFSFAFLNVTRTRGINVDKVTYDEFQDFDPSFPPIIREAMGGSPHGGLQQYMGTPKTLDGPLEDVWVNSSQAEWAMRCKACNYINIPSLAQDLEKMLGPMRLRRTLSEEAPGVVCAKCGKPVFPREGRWVHAFPERRFTQAGYHVPQFLMPHKYADDEAWREIQAKRQGFGNTTPAQFFNEVCGESYDSGSKLISIGDIKAAAQGLGPNGDIARVQKTLDDYTHRVLAVDWGGGGEAEISYTAAALCCLLPNGEIHVPFGWRSLTPHDPALEVSRLLRLYAAFRCENFVHDYNGFGDVKEQLLINAGLDATRTIPMVYIRAGSGPIMRMVPRNLRTQQRQHFRVDKNRSLHMLALLIKYKRVKFFDYDGSGDEKASLLRDFLSLVEDRLTSRIGLDIQTVIQNKAAGPDDFAQAVNMGVCALFHKIQRWPDLSDIAGLELTEEVINHLSQGPPGPWGQEIFDADSPF